MIKGLLFDKDGTLFDFRATWAGWTERLLTELAGADAGLRAALVAALRYHPELRDFSPDSPIVAHTNDEIAQVIAPFVPAFPPEALLARMNHLAGQVAVVEAVPLRAVLGAMHQAGLVLGLCTNDAEAAAHRHLAQAGVDGLFTFVAGYDSGHGAKPDPDPLLAFCAATGLAPAEVAMVGDSRHDLIAGRAAGMLRIGVLTGIASAEMLAPDADVVLPTIAEIPGWLAANGH